MDVIDDEVMNIINVYLINDPLMGVLWNFRSDEFEGYNELISSFMGLGPYNKNLL